MREKLRRTEERLAPAEAAAAAALLAAMVGLAFLQVVLRWFGAGLQWGETLLRHMVLWTGFLGAGLAASRDRHFAWEAFHARAPRGLRPWLRLAASLTAAAVCLLLARAGVDFASAARASGEILLSAAGRELPAWPAWSAIPGGFALLGAHALFKAADAALEAAGAREPA